MTIWIGLDIGLTGAMAALLPNGSASVADLPTIETEAGKRLHGRGLLDLLREWVPATERCVIVVEDIRPRPQGNGGSHGNTMHSQGSLMRSRGIVECMADIAGAPVCWVHPQKWKRHYRLLGKDKDESRAMALTLMPSMRPALARKKDHNRAESLLLAHWGKATQA